MTIGSRILDARRALGLQQKQLAEKAGLTPSLVSQIERDRVSPSLNTLRKLAGALGVSLSQFFEEPMDDHIKIVRKSEHSVLSFEGSSERWTILAAGLVRGKIRAVVATLAPGERSGSGDKIVVERGQMKLCYVIRGAIEILYNGKTYGMEAGDSAYLDGGVNHSWANPGRARARVLWVITDTRS